MEKAKEIPAASVSEICSKDGVYKVMSSRGKIEYDVKIVGGTCSCPYFLREKIPCKHIFSVFEHYKWSWANLPSALTESPHMILEMNIIKTDHCEPHYVDNADQVAAASHVDPVVDHVDPVVDHADQASSTSQSVYTEIPTYQPSGKRLLSLQKRIRDNLAKCSVAIFMVDNISLLEELDEKMNSIHAVLMQAASTTLSSEQIPVMKCLMSEEVSEYKKKINLISRANQLTKKYRTIREKKKRKVHESTCPLPKKQPRLKDDPLHMATRRSIGRPKGKKIKKDMSKTAECTIYTFVY